MALTPITPHIPRVEEFLTHCHRRRYPAKSTIIYAGDTGDILYYIIKGSVTVIIEDDDGREMIVAYLNPGLPFWTSPAGWRERCSICATSRMQ